MAELSDEVLGHLREVAEAPALEGTRYELLREIGRGGMGRVYLARDTQLDREVALKVLDSQAEARTLASLEHPGIVPVHDAGTMPDGRAFYAMKLVQGRRLDDYTASNPPLAERLRVFLKICDPVAFAHAHGLAHRDLKPANIMIGPFGEVLVLDWGIARRIADGVAGVAGTAGYMAPEAGPADERTDVYSLGKMLEYLVRGAVPGKPLRAIASKAAHVDRARRYATVPELAADVARYLDGEPVTAYRESALERAARLLKRHKTLTVMIAAYILARAAVFFWTRR